VGRDVLYASSIWLSTDTSGEQLQKAAVLACLEDLTARRANSITCHRERNHIRREPNRVKRFAITYACEDISLSYRIESEGRLRPE
jgi:hypothetical protein